MKNNLVFRHLTALSMYSDKAFDTVDHKILRKKLELYRIKVCKVRWFESYSSNRKQFTQGFVFRAFVIPNFVSNYHKVTKY